MQVFIKLFIFSRNREGVQYPMIVHHRSHVQSQGLSLPIPILILIKSISFAPDRSDLPISHTPHCRHSPSLRYAVADSGGTSSIKAIDGALTV